MFLNCQIGGMNMAPVDVGLMPTPAGPVPTPVPNTAPRPASIPTCFTVLICGGPAHNLLTMTPTSIGTPFPGVASGMMMGPSRNLVGAFTTLVGGAPATRLTDASLSNLTNAPGLTSVPAQVKVLCLK